MQGKSKLLGLTFMIFIIFFYVSPSQDEIGNDIRRYFGEIKRIEIVKENFCTFAVYKMDKKLDNYRIDEIISRNDIKIDGSKFSKFERTPISDEIIYGMSIKLFTSIVHNSCDNSSLKYNLYAKFLEKDGSLYSFSNSEEKMILINVEEGIIFFRYVDA